jgi:Icc-related predicted phosphoesterase
MRRTWPVSLLLLLFLLPGWTAGQSPVPVKINGDDYTVDGAVIRQATSSYFADGVLRIAVVADIESHHKNVQLVADKIKPAKPDLIVVAGDSYANDLAAVRPVYPSFDADAAEMAKALRPLADLGVPVLVIPGHMEIQPVYTEAILRLHKKGQTNVLDLNGRVADLQGVNLVGLGGYHLREFKAASGKPMWVLPAEGFLIGKEQYDTAAAQIRQLLPQGEPVVLVTHGPPRTDTALDLVVGVGQAGDTALADVLKACPAGGPPVINVHGHLHERGGESCAAFPAGPSYNAASVTLTKNPRAPNLLMVVVTPDGRMAAKYF